MADLISLTQLSNASVDAQTLADAINGNDQLDVTSRLGATYPTLAKAIKTIMSKAPINSTPFATKSALLADTTLADGAFAFVYNDDITANNGVYQKASGAWAYIKANATKKTALKSGDDLNNINQTGIYYNFADIPQAELLNMPSYPNGLALNGTLVVYDPLDAGTLALHQIFYPSNSVNAWHRKKIGVGLFSNWVQSVTTDTVNQIKNLTLAEAQTLDVHTMPVGVYSWDDFPQGNAIANMPPITYKFGRLEIKTTASDASGAYRMAIFYPYGQNKEFWINKNYETGWTGWLRYADADTLKAEITGAPQAFKPSLITPPRFYAMEGIETHIYPEHLVIDDYSLYNHRVFAYRGKHVNRGFVWLPNQATDSVGQYGVNWALHDKQTASELVKTSLLITLVDKNAKSGQTPKVMVIGDSYVESGVITQQLLDNATNDVMKIQLVGARGTAPNKHEGRSGWKVEQYAGSSSPFYIGGKIDFKQYLINNSLATPDIIMIELGVNDSFAMASDAEVVTLTATAFSNLDMLIANFKLANPNIKVGLCLPPRYADQDAFGHDYGATYDAWRCSRNISVWNRELIARYKDSEVNNIYIVASGFNVDTVNNYPTEQQPINSHNSTLIDVQSNSVHPYPKGYQQIGDAMFTFIKAV